LPLGEGVQTFAGCRHLRAVQARLEGFLIGKVEHSHHIVALALQRSADVSDLGSEQSRYFFYKRNVVFEIRFVETRRVRGFFV
jgi:hypothetical protein